MKSVLISIQPKWCELIASGKKTIEVRKTKPKLETPFKVYIYCTKGENLWKNKNLPFMAYNRIIDNLPEHLLNGKVIGEFVCDEIIVADYGSKPKTMLDEFELLDYADGKAVYGWHISNLVIYDKPKELSEFVVEGDCLNGDCKKCRWFDGGNGYNVEADCLLTYDYNFKKTVKPLFRPPQSWCYVESEVDTE